MISSSEMKSRIKVYPRPGPGPNAFSGNRRSAKQRFGKMTFGLMTIRQNDVRLSDDSRKWRSAKQRSGKMTFGIINFLQFDDSDISQLSQMMLGDFIAQQGWGSKFQTVKF